MSNTKQNTKTTAEQGGQVDAIVSGSLPTVDEAGAIAVSLSEHLTAQEQSFFTAGFQECIKYLNVIKC